jgi:hypothetical protein
MAHGPKQFAPQRLGEGMRRRAAANLTDDLAADLIQFRRDGLMAGQKKFTRRFHVFSSNFFKVFRA